MAEKRIPAIRSVEFTDDWERRKLEDIATRVSTMSDTPDLPRVEYEDINSGQGTLNKDLREKISTKFGIRFQPGDVLYGKLRPYLKNWLFADFPGIAVGDFWVLRGNDVDGLFLYSLIQSDRFDDVANQSTGTKMPRADWPLVSKAKFFVPCQVSEQRQIGAFLLNLDHLITLHQRKYEKLMNVRASMLENLFVQSGDSTPKIRFGEYTKPWKKVPLSELVQLYSDPVETPHGGYDRLGIRSHGKGVFHDHVEVGKELGTAKMHRVAAHNLIVNITFAWEHAVAITTEDDEGKLVSHRFPQFSMTEDVYDQFLKYLVLDPRFRHHLLLASPGGAGRNRVLKVPEMLQYEMMIPEIEEQKEIAGYLNSLDELIALYAQRMEQLKHIKQAFLQKMFP